MTGGGESTTDLMPDTIQRLGGAFRASKAFLTAVELGVFTELARGPLSAEALAARIGIQPRASVDFFDALVALGILERDGSVYSNTPEADLYLDRGKRTYIGGMAEMQGTAGYQLWGSLSSALRTGEPQTTARGNFDLLYEDPRRTKRFLAAMTGGTLATARAMAKLFPWDEYRTFIDIGTAQGCLPVEIALRHEHLTGGGFDLPPVGVHFDHYVASFDLGSRLRFFPGDLRVDPIPGADVLVLGNMLSDFDLEGKHELLRKAYCALPVGGALVVYESLIDDDRRRNAAALLTSLATLLHKTGAFGFTGSQCRSWMEDIGFVKTNIAPLEGPRAMVIGEK